MVGLLDIAPPEELAETVEIRGVPLTVHGISARALARIISRFPQLERGLTAEAGMESSAAIVAAALGQNGDAATEALIVDRLSAGEMALLVEAINRLTMPAPPQQPAAPAPNGAATGKSLSASTTSRPQLNG